MPKGKVQSMRALEPKLLKDEHVIYQSGYHWVFVFKAFLPLLLVVVLGSIAWQFQPMRLTSALVMLALIASIVWVVLKLFESMIKKAYVTNKRLIYRTGWTHRDTVDVTLDRIGGIKLDQDFWQRFFGYGTVQVIVPVVVIILPRFLRNPFAFRKALYMKAAAAKAPEKPDDDELAEEHDRLAREEEDRFGAETVSLKELQEIADLEGAELGADLGADLGTEYADHHEIAPDDADLIEADADADALADASADAGNDGGADGSKEPRWRGHVIDSHRLRWNRRYAARFGRAEATAAQRFTYQPS